MMGFLKVGAFALLAFGIAVYAAVHKNDPPKVASPQAAALALLPSALPLVANGTIVFDNAPASDQQAFLLYSEEGTGGSSSVKTKRLVLPAQYACMQGDVPCAAPAGARHPFAAGDRVRVAGTVDADLLYVDSIEILR